MGLIYSSLRTIRTPLGSFLFALPFETVNFNYRTIHTWLTYPHKGYHERYQVFHNGLSEKLYEEAVRKS